MRFNHVINDLGAGILLRACPDAETKSPFRFQNTTCFRTCHFGMRHVEQTEVTQNPIKTGVWKWQSLSIALDERYVGKHHSCDSDHSFREIDSCRNLAQLFHLG